MAIVLAVAPHPDDETLGCGGTLLRHVAGGDAVHWLIATAMHSKDGFPAERIAARERELEAVAEAYAFSATHRLGLPTTRLDTLPLGELVREATAVFEKVRPAIVYLPHPGDAHSDHARVFDMCAPATKWFRLDCVREVLTYETLSSTGFHPDPGRSCFRPNLYVDIGPHLERKIDILGLYEGESGPFPFPRSAEAIRAQAALRGTESGFHAAEAFMALRMRR